jgi:hypothetical protein
MFPPIAMVPKAMVCSWWMIYLERIIDVLLLFCDNFNETDFKKLL